LHDVAEVAVSTDFLPPASRPDREDPDMPTFTKRTAKYGLVIGTIVAVVLVLGFYFRRSIGAGGGAEDYPISWFIIVAAILGSVVNQPFRHGEMQRASVGWMAGYLFWKSTVSIVFAFVLYLMFIAGLVSGDLFPHFVRTTVETGGQYVNMKEFATKVDPASYKDVAKILVWSFIAGYSEKFVPNLIAQLLKTSRERGGK
jgi:hypothetical protein